MMSNDNTTPVQRVEPNLFQLKGEKNASQLSIDRFRGRRTVDLYG